MSAKGTKVKDLKWIKRAHEKTKRKPRTRISPPLGHLEIISGSRKRLPLVSSRFTEEKGKMIITAIRNGHHPEMIAAFAGVTNRIVEAWIREGTQILDATIDQDISHLPERERELCKFTLTTAKAMADMQEENLGHIRAARPQWWQAAAWLLERRFPDQWGKQNKVKHEGEAPQNRTDVKILVANPDAVRALGDVFRHLMETGGQSGTRAIGPGGMGDVRKSRVVETRAPSPPAERHHTEDGGRGPGPSDSPDTPKTR